MEGWWQMAFYLFIHVSNCLTIDDSVFFSTVIHRSSLSIIQTDRLTPIYTSLTSVSAYGSSDTHADYSFKINTFQQLNANFNTISRNEKCFSNMTSKSCYKPLVYKACHACKKCHTRLRRSCCSSRLFWLQNASLPSKIIRWGGVMTALTCSV